MDIMAYFIGEKVPPAIFGEGECKLDEGGVSRTFDKSIGQSDHEAVRYGHQFPSACGLLDFQHQSIWHDQMSHDHRGDVCTAIRRVMSGGMCIRDQPPSSTSVVPVR
jgi:hypothetical protein